MDVRTMARAVANHTRLAADPGMDTSKLDGFEFNGMWIIDPTVSDCMRFDVDPHVHYGEAYHKWLDNEGGTTPWIHLSIHRLLEILEQGYHIRRRDGNGIEYHVLRNSGDQTVLCQADTPSKRMIVPTAEIIAEFEEVK